MATGPDVTATFCATLVDEWVRMGVRDVVVCPGSRSTPLALAVAAAAPRGHAVGSFEAALVQGGGEQGTRKEDTGVVVPFENHVAATALVRPPVDLVVWPEDVIDTRGAFVDDPWYADVAALARGLRALKDAIDEGPLIDGLVDVGRWLEEFHPRALVELDYGGLVHTLPAGELEDDHSAADVAEGIAALRRGDGVAAGEAYGRLLERWRAVRDRRSAN